jgi:hypothetical protein
MCGCVCELMCLMWLCKCGTDVHVCVDVEVFVVGVLW